VRNFVAREVGRRNGPRGGKGTRGAGFQDGQEDGTELLSAKKSASCFHGDAVGLG
jgi:hypothetical protein